MEKLERFIRSWTQGVLGLRNQLMLKQFFDAAAQYYQKGTGNKTRKSNRCDTEKGR